MTYYYEETESVKTPRQMSDGIYFDMPFDVYMAQDAFSNSRVNKINDSVLNYWVDEIEPTLADDFDLQAKLDESTESMEEGKAWHVMALEGEDAFDALYAAGYDPSVYPDALQSKDEHIAACEAHGVAFNKSDTIAKLQDRLIDAGVGVQFHSTLKVEHEAAAAGKTLFSIDKLSELKRAGEVIRQYGLDKTMLSGGFPEASILVTIDGVRYKCRCDYLKPDMIIEYKTLSVKSRKKPFEEICAEQMHNFGYFTAAYLYQICVEAARVALHKDLSFAHGLPDAQESVDWIDAFISGGERTRHEYWFLFQERGKYNHVLPRRFDKYDEITQSRKIQRMWKTGQLDVEHAVAEYNRCMEEFGRETRWLPTVHPKPWDDMDFKPWQIVE